MSNSKKTFKQKLAWILLHVFWVFPINTKRISFLCYGCSQYSCNPKYISRYIHENYADQFEQVWFYDNIELKNQLPDYVKKYKKNSFHYFWALTTSKFVIANVTLPRVVHFRKRQVKVNTWHGTAFKGDRNKFGNDYNRFDYFIAENQLTEKVFRLKESFNYQGNILEIGMPRNDILINADVKLGEKVKAKLGISSDTKVVLYAPTFRDSSDSDCFGIDFKKLLDGLVSKFGGNWIVLFRYHHLQKNKVYVENCVDVSNYPDMQELMIMSNILITDYSSTMWDYSFTNKLVLLFATDIARYVGKERGNFYYPLDRLPFPIATCNKELLQGIYSYDYEEYIKEIKRYHNELGRFNYTGNATKKFVEKIIIENKGV